MKPITETNDRHVFSPCGRLSTESLLLKTGHKNLKGEISMKTNKSSIAGITMSAPVIIMLTTFLIIPIIGTIYFSFFKYQVMRPDAKTFNGLNNYLKLLTDENFYTALKNTVYFSVLVVPFQCTLALALALLVRSKMKGVAIFRTMYFSPQVTSMVVIAILWVILYNSNANTGLINAAFSRIGMGPFDFLNNPKIAMNSIVFMSAWQGAGYQMMIFLAGLNAIPSEQYEAASVDGANPVDQFLYVTLPGLKNTIKYVLMITIIQAMKLFTQPYIMTKGGPQNKTKTMVYYIYEQGFQKGNFGYACCIAAIFFFIVVFLSLVVKKLTRTK